MLGYKATSNSPLKPEKQISEYFDVKYIKNNDTLIQDELMIE